MDVVGLYSVSIQGSVCQNVPIPSHLDTTAIHRWCGVIPSQTPSIVLSYI